MHRLLALLTLGVFACASSFPSAEHLARALSLRLEPYARSASVGERARVKYVLTNSSADAVVACIGEARGYHIFGTAKDSGEALRVDHANCVRSFRLGSGQSLEWDEEIEIGDVGKGSARLNGWVQIVDSRQCDRKYGCEAANVTAPFVVLELTGKGDEAPTPR
jgi:hypothetical protein